jgi:hypothetical protein
MAIDIRHIALRGNTAVAIANVTTIDDDDDRRTARYTFRLVKEGQDWKVELQQ